MIRYGTWADFTIATEDTEKTEHTESTETTGEMTGSARSVSSVDKGSSLIRHQLRKLWIGAGMRPPKLTKRAD